MKLLITLLLFPFIASSQNPAPNGGSWEWKDANNTYTILMADGYAMVSKYDVPGKKFFESYGGIYAATGDSLSLKIQFHTADKSKAGKTENYIWKSSGNDVSSNLSGTTQTWKKLAGNENALSGNWRITSRMVDGKQNEIALAPRRTLKLLAGNHFQWAAINTDTGEFFGTGGGTYSFENGKYIENILFFSRDSSRVGANLQFDGKLENGEWHHSGKSSKGDPLHEVWSRFK